MSGASIVHFLAFAGHIGRTFPTEKSNVNSDKMIDEEFVMPKVTNKFLQTDDRKVFNPDADAFKRSKWCYDTPGVVHPDQVPPEVYFTAQSPGMNYSSAKNMCMILSTDYQSSHHRRIK